MTSSFSRKTKTFSHYIWKRRRRRRSFAARAAPSYFACLSTYHSKNPERARGALPRVKPPFRQQQLLQKKKDLPFIHQNTTTLLRFSAQSFFLQTHKHNMIQQGQQRKVGGADLSSFVFFQVSRKKEERDGLFSPHFFFATKKNSKPKSFSTLDSLKENGPNRHKKLVTITMTTHVPLFYKNASARERGCSRRDA